MLKELGDKVSEEDKKLVETAKEELAKVKDSDDVEEINAKIEALNEVSMKLGQQMYQASQAEAQAGQTAGGAEAEADAKPEEDVVEGEVEEK
jgi:molecular chaperone DnaK